MQIFVKRTDVAAPKPSPHRGEGGAKRRMRGRSYARGAMARRTLQSLPPVGEGAEGTEADEGALLRFAPGSAFLAVFPLIRPLTGPPVRVAALSRWSHPCPSLVPLPSRCGRCAAVGDWRRMAAEPYGCGVPLAGAASATGGASLRPPKGKVFGWYAPLAFPQGGRCRAQRGG